MLYNKIFAIFAVGFFSICAQTVIFREFLTAFDSGKIAVSFFFFSWLFWVIFSAFLVGKKPGLRYFMGKHLPFIFLLYIPAFFLQFIIIIFYREIFGLKVFEIPSFLNLLFHSIILNFPISILTGFFFQLSSDFIFNYYKDAVPIVHRVEAFGAFIAGISSIIFFLFGGRNVSFAIFATIIFLFFLSFSFERKKAIFLSILSLILFFLTFFFKVDLIISEKISEKRWKSIIPEGIYLGSFSTHQAEYIYGKYFDQLIFLRNHGIYETFPSEDEQILPLTVAFSQRKNYDNVAIIGSKLPFAISFTELSNVKKIHYFPEDIQYAEKILLKFSQNFNQDLKEKFHLSYSDFLDFVKSNKDKINLFFIDLNGFEHPSIERLCSLEFIKAIKRALRDDSIVIFAFDSAENYLSDEFALSGSILWNSVRKNFDNVMLLVGEKTFVIGSNSQLAKSREEMLLNLKDAQIREKKLRIAPSLINVIADSDRIKIVREKFENIGKKIKTENRINDNSLGFRPIFLYLHLHSININNLLKILYIREWIFITPLLLFFVVSLFFIEKHKIEKEEFRFYMIFEVFISGFIGLSSVLILINIFQLYKGTIFLYFGLLTSLFMLGISLGNYLASREFIKLFGSKKILLLSLSFSNIVFIIIFFLTRGMSFSIFLLGFFFGFSGLLNGLLFNSVWQIAFYGSSSIYPFIIADNAGASISTLLVGLLMLSLAGISNTLLFLILVSTISIAIFAISQSSQTYRFLGPFFINWRILFYYILLSTTLSCVFIFNIFQMKEEKSAEDDKSTIALSVLSELAPGYYFEKEFLEGGKFFYSVRDRRGELVGVIFKSTDFIEPIDGFAGPFEIAIFADGNRRLVSFKVLEHSDTPAYVKKALSAYEKLKGVKIDDSSLVNNIDSITGATFSSEAIKKTIFFAGENFYKQKHNIIVKNRLYNLTPSSLSHISYVIFFFIFAFIVSLKGNKLYRLIILSFSILISYFILKLQFSSESILKIIFYPWHIPIFIMLIVLMIFIFGNFYCGYICPFGALQELFHYIKNKILRRNYDYIKSKYSYLSVIKYLVLAYIVLGYIFMKSQILKIINYDPLGNFMLSPFSMPVIFFMCISLFFPRCWCRIFCPAGAF
ncbi:MAG TPA: 4Fe-4S binding protein, partial [Victivallales bacterium]|nr:4Fe-4S binding protein [Victivallales bacterium]